MTCVQVGADTSHNKVTIRKMQRLAALLHLEPVIIHYDFSRGQLP